MSARASVVVVCALLVAASGAAEALPAAALGKPLPSPDLATGTLVVRVIDGAVDAPRAGATVTLTGDGAPRTATTDDTGRVRFEGLTAGATVTARVSVSPAVSSERMVVPDAGGLRVVLSTRPLRPSVRPARKLSGEVTERDEDAGAVEVRVTYDDLNDARPPAGVVVSLVGYAADDGIRVARRRTDAKGIARFAGLDATGAVAYYALAQLPRKRAADRLVSSPILLREGHGAEVVLSAALRTATSPPIDDNSERGEVADDKTPAAPVARGKLRVRLAGDAATATRIRVLDVATGKQIAQGVVPDKELVLGVAARAGQVLYVEATAAGQRVRSLPFEVVADRGAGVTLYVLPRVLAGYEVSGFADDAAMVFQMRVELTNYAWAPYRAPRTLAIPLPAGATAVETAPDMAAVVHGASVEITRPLPPGGVKLPVNFELPAVAGEVALALDLPFGAYTGLIAIEDEPGLSIDRVSPGLQVQTRQVGRTYRVIEGTSLPANQTLAMTVHLPRPRPEVALQHACRRLGPDATPLVGQALDFTLKRPDGRVLKLSALRGKPLLINMTATWNGMSRSEVPRLAALSLLLPVVMVASDADPKAVLDEIGAQPFPIVLDPPKQPDDAVGAVTQSWGVTRLPESVLVDRTGVVRFHFQNVRDWDTPEAQRCVRAFLAAR